MPLGIDVATFTGGKDVVLGIGSVKNLGTFPEFQNSLLDFGIHGNHSFARVRFARANQQCSAEEVDITPL